MDQLRIRFGSYVQVWEPSAQTNSLKMRRRRAIALGPLQMSTTSYLFLALDTGMIINRAQFTEIPMTAAVIARVNELGYGKPELLTWTNRQGETIGDGPLWDTTETRNDNASITSANMGATEDDDDNDVIVAEEDRGAMPTTDVNLVDNIAGVDMRMDTQDTYEVWNKEVPEYNVGDVDQINDDVKVTEKSALGGVTTTRCDQPLKVIPTITDENKVLPTGTD
jgi:hypothetical protein